MIYYLQLSYILKFKYTYKKLNIKNIEDENLYINYITYWLYWETYIYKKQLRGMHQIKTFLTFFFGKAFYKSLYIILY